MTTAPPAPANNAPRCLTNTLDHLPEPKRHRLQLIKERICQTVPLDWLVLFGSYARGDWVEDPIHRYFSDYDLLVVVSEEFLLRRSALWERLERELQAIAGRVPVSLLVHTGKEVNHEIRMGQYFFCDIMNEGVVLHDGHRSQFAHVKAQTPEERLALAQHNFRYWFNSAAGFWQGTRYFMNRGELAHAAFLLHQSVERYYHSVTLVFNGYKNKCHNIAKLADMGAELHQALVGAMPREEVADKALFDLLKRAYIEARYSKSYRISEEELTLLRARVSDLAQRVLAACGEKLASFCGAEAVGALPAVPEDEEAPGLPPLPDVEDRGAMERWGRLVAAEQRETGIAEGLERGLADGKEQGELARARRIAETLLAKGMPAEEVAETTGLSVEEVTALAGLC
ncbi:HEPN domain-containing protein [Endothiovibrio diazotrophicus]